MNRYPEKQAREDEESKRVWGRVASIRPGDRLRVRGLKGQGRGPVVMGVALITKVVGEEAEAAFVSTREYGRRWFETGVLSPFTVIEELS